jgi:quercetin dioxygenase-like cupin family protein
MNINRCKFVKSTSVLVATTAIAKTFSQARKLKDIVNRMIITRNESIASVEGPTDYFTGKVRIETLFQPEEPARTGAAYVTFEPGARTTWHTHPLGQRLVITQGLGKVQVEGGPIETVHPGDVVWFPPQVKHWHGTSREKAMKHLAIQEALDGSAVTWMEKVSDEQYNQDK